jgi:hypothetical protein
VKGRLRFRYVVLAGLAVAVPVWTAYSASGASGGTSHVARAPAALCQTLNGIFSDGPDPDADPVGYALSQIRPLEAIHTADDSVSAALTKLIAADRALVQSNGIDPAARSAIKTADASVNDSCPGVVS